MRFYRGAAHSLIESTRHTFSISAILKYLWRPAGVDLLGETAWFTAFADFLADDEYRARILRIDDLVKSMPGLGEPPPSTAAAFH